MSPLPFGCKKCAKRQIYVVNRTTRWPFCSEPCPNLRFHFLNPPTHPALPYALCKIGSRLSALSWVASGPFGLRTRSPDQLRSPDLDFGLRTLERGTHAAPPKHCIYKQGHALSCLFTFWGGQCDSCSRRTSALEAVQLLATPVKRTAAASDELCSF